MSTTTQKAISRGDTVKVRLFNGTVREFTIVDSRESSPEKGKISDSCPLGKAILGARVGEKRSYRVNNKVLEVEIVG